MSVFNSYATAWGLVPQVTYFDRSKTWLNQISSYALSARASG